MNPDTGHLVRDIKSVTKEKFEKYQQVPTQLQAQARRALGCRESVYINMKRDTSKLAAWARKTKEKNRRRAKVEKLSRRKNRNK